MERQYRTVILADYHYTCYFCPFGGERRARRSGEEEREGGKEGDTAVCVDLARLKNTTKVTRCRDDRLVLLKPCISQCSGFN